MSKICGRCGKRAQRGNSVSHANNKSKRWFTPNLQRVRVVIANAVKRIRLCTTCLRSGGITKPA